MTVKVKSENPLRNRSCLRCRKSFLSEGFHNRICERCKETADYGFTDFAFEGDTGVMRLAQNHA